MLSSNKANIKVEIPMNFISLIISLSLNSSIGVKILAELLIERIKVYKNPESKVIILATNFSSNVSRIKTRSLLRLPMAHKSSPSLKIIIKF